MAEDHRQEHRHGADREREPHRAGDDVTAPLAQELEGADTDHQHRGGGEGAEDRVRVGQQHGRVGQHREDVLELGAMGHVVDRVADRVLHPRVGGEDEVGRDHRANRGGPDRGEVELRRQPPPAEDPQADEGRFEEERDQCLHRERGAEDVTHVLGIERPVHAELELLDDAGHDADGHRDEQELAPEAGHAEIDLAPRPVVQGLAQRDEDREPDRHRHEDEMEQGCDAELAACEVESGHGGDLRITGPTRHRPFADHEMWPTTQPLTVVCAPMYQPILGRLPDDPLWANVRAIGARAITTEGLTKRYGDTVALDGLDLQVGGR